MKANVACRASTVLGGLVAAVVMAGCGSAGSSGHSAPPPAPQTTHTTQTTPAAQRATSPTSPAGSTSPAAAAAAVVTIRNFAYRVPKSVAPGAKVTVRNADQVAHTVTADRGDSLFNVSVDPGDTATFSAPTTPGSYTFHCNYHSNMHATLVVK